MVSHLRVQYTHDSYLYAISGQVIISNILHVLGPITLRSQSTEQLFLDG